jgi:pyrimidine-nucleoside phosphorylase
MRGIDIITKKRDGKNLTQEEIDFFINGYISGLIPDYQMAALLMCIYFKGLDFDETFHLTKIMLESGTTIDLSSIEGVKVDKHSTGGVGDKTTLVVAPLAAAGGVVVPKMSGHGLGHTGGTLDKLAAIPGFRTQLSNYEFLKVVDKIGIAVTGQTENIVPADKKIYELRDVTGTIENISLIASSIMSKKFAMGSDAILLDVKTGSGAFMKTTEDSIKLAEIMLRIGIGFGKNVKACITDMKQPLGNTVGNSLEVEEAISTLKGEGPEDFTELCIELAAQMFILGGKVTDADQGRNIARKLLENGKALEKFEQWVEAQFGNPNVTKDKSLLPIAEHSFIVISKNEGYISSINAEQVGICAMKLGAGREKKGELIDLSAGIRLLKKVGEHCEIEEPIAILYTSLKNRVYEVTSELLSSFKYSHEPYKSAPLVYSVIG